ncbi:wall-associated receptor kinase-like 8 [Ricinus communis]|uniref:wall-associated receptor kinase-like 8 n=1 Tax=Ricinus communis TaxID=3988 RepID=UPI00077241A6|nr:wall-associated receptor kinase-like 8 [Ricinus communis]|eukprot:XP_015583659.1 wall-associated receptor kinase-like 8 [Ricinus communis]
MAVQLVLLFRIIIFPWLINSSMAAASVAKPGCSDRCGNVTIPYPFGIGEGCYMDSGFAVTCNKTSLPYRPYLTSINLELLRVSLESTLVRVNNPVLNSNCQDRPPVSDLSFSGSPFSFSDNNRFTALGCNNLALIYRQDMVIGGCLSICNVTVTESSCYGINCCQTSIPPYLKFINASLRSIDPVPDEQCRVAFMVDREWFSSNASDNISALLGAKQVPAVLEWGISNGTCADSPGAENSTDICGSNASCSVKVGINYQCSCNQGYEGNPYLSCQDINECEDSQKNKCSMICVNTPGSYKCSCPDGYISMGNNCYLTDGYTERFRPVIAIVLSAGLGIPFLLIGTWWLYKVQKRRKDAKLRQRFFKRNGGLLLQQQLSSSESSIEKTNMFTAKELEKATDHYNENRILGQGGQGTVYKGMLTDGKVVAIKKSKIADESKTEQFINEVVILSQINHRNVVKLLGCCLETEVPLLVYEFIPNGTLYQHLHDPSEEFPITWEMRLRIAIETGSALSYLHSAASVPIYHRDIKSTNILLDDKYRAKVSDFGTSKSIAVDQTHVTTRVQGTFGYLDPEYFQSSQFTEKSDVYSFGVVLVELLTGQKPISSARAVEERSLAMYFLLSMEQNRLFEILDARVLKEGGKEEILAVAKLARRCLNLNGKKRPTMRTVVTEVERIRASQQGTCFTNGENDYQELDCFVSDYNAPWDVASPSTASNSYTSLSVSSTGKLLLYN